jgi:OmpA-OmpF porin, OOP family
MSINLVHAVNAAMTDNIAEQLSRQFGIPVQFVRQVALRVTPGLVAALMDRASLAAGARSLYSVVMLPDTNAYIVDQFDKMISTTGGLKHLESTGHSLAALATGQRMDLLTDAVATETGVPTQATSALAGIVAAALFGIVKRHALLAQWNAAQLPGLLRAQVEEVKASLTNGVAAAIGVGNTEGFASNIGARLDSVSAAMMAQEPDGASSAHASGGAMHVSTMHASTTASAPAASAAPVAKPAPANLRAPSRPPVERRSKSWIWALFAVLAVILGFVYYQGFTHQNALSLDQSSAAPVAAGETPASAASTQAIALEDTASVASAVVETASGAAAEPASAVAASTPDVSAQVAGKDAQLVFDVSPAGVPNIRATVGTHAEKQALTQALDQRFGKNQITAITVSPDTRPAAWLSRVSDFLPLMSVPGAEVKVDGSNVELSGAATDSKLGWTTRLQGVLGSAFTVGSFDVSGAIASAQHSFQSAVKSLLAADSACAGPQLTKVLDLQVVNFERSSAILN